MGIEHIILFQYILTQNGTGRNNDFVVCLISLNAELQGARSRLEPTGGGHTVNGSVQSQSRGQGECSIVNRQLNVPVRVVHTVVISCNAGDVHIVGVGLVRSRAVGMGIKHIVIFQYILTQFRAGRNSDLVLALVSTQRKGQLAFITSSCLEPDLTGFTVQTCHIGQGKCRIIHIQNNVPVRAAEGTSANPSDIDLLRQNGQRPVVDGEFQGIGGDKITDHSPRGNLNGGKSQITKRRCTGSHQIVVDQQYLTAEILIVVPNLVCAASIGMLGTIDSHRFSGVPVAVALQTGQIENAPGTGILDGHTADTLSGIDAQLDLSQLRTTGRGQLDNNIFPNGI